MERSFRFLLRKKIPYYGPRKQKEAREGCKLGWSERLRQKARVIHCFVTGTQKIAIILNAIDV